MPVAQRVANSDLEHQTGDWVRQGDAASLSYGGTMAFVLYDGESQVFGICSEKSPSMLSSPTKANPN